MGFNFQAGHPTGIFEGKYAQRVAEQFQAKFGASLPLGKEGLLGKGRVFRLRDEIGWSWWGELQELGKEELGEKACPQLLGADAWSAVYVDAKEIGRAHV